MAFQNPLGSGENAPDDFQLWQVPAATPPNPPVIHDVVALSGNRLRLNFTESVQSATPFPIQPRRWTCVTHIASNTTGCVGFLPADVDGNGMAMLADIIKLVDDLNGLVQWAKEDLGIEPSTKELAQVISTLGELGYLDAGGAAAADGSDLGLTPGVVSAPRSGAYYLNPLD